MSTPDFIPVLPESAPFSPEQRAYLNGFLAGLFSRAPAPGRSATVRSAPKPLLPVAILFGSQTGNSENLAKRIAKESGRHGFAPTVHDLARYPVAQLDKEQNVLIVTSTYGDGDPPDNAKSFWHWLNSPSAPALKNTRFSLLALGDSNYQKFCGFGVALDARLEQLGATRVYPRSDCDVDFEAPYQKWLMGALPALAGHPPALSQLSVDLGRHSTEFIGSPSTDTSDAGSLFPVYCRNNPFPARVLINRRLCGAQSSKDVRHVEISLEGSDLAYEAGDALGVVPTNDPALVDEILAALGCDGEEAVPANATQMLPLRLALLSHYDITKISQPLLKTIAEKSGDEALRRVAAPEANGESARFLWGREIIDLLLACPQVRFEPVEFVSLLKKLQPRLYSISSSPKAHPKQVHLTVGVVNYESHGRRRRGVCSDFLTNRVNPDTAVPVFVQTNKAFRPPPPEAALIMIGPGTGIAPFRAFLQDRREMGARGKSWLFFGDQHAETDFLYRDELESLQRDGVLGRIDTAFSRDQTEKVYVQHRMREQAQELFAWLEDGACLYVCGDASRMARDVDRALHQIVESSGQQPPEKAAEYVRELQAQRRYQRDVY